MRQLYSQAEQFEAIFDLSGSRKLSKEEAKEILKEFQTWGEKVDTLRRQIKETPRSRPFSPEAQKVVSTLAKVGKAHIHARTTVKRWAAQYTDSVFQVDARKELNALASVLEKLSTKQMVNLMGPNPERWLQRPRGPSEELSRISWKIKEITDLHVLTSTRDHCLIECALLLDSVRSYFNQGELIPTTTQGRVRRILDKVEHNLPAFTGSIKTTLAGGNEGDVWWLTSTGYSCSVHFSNGMLGGHYAWDAHHHEIAPAQNLFLTETQEIVVALSSAALKFVASTLASTEKLRNLLPIDADTTHLTPLKLTWFKRDYCH